MFNPELRLAVSLACLLASASAAACGPFFPQQLLDDRKSSLFDLPDGMFMFEAARLVPKPHDTLRAVEGSPYDEHEQTLAAADAMGLSSDEAAKVKAMRAAPDLDAAAKAGQGLSPDLYEYTLGAIAFHKGDRPTAQTRLRAVLELPAPQRAHRGLWAQYTLARSLLADGDTAGASAAFENVRKQVEQGIPDPQGLAVASLGEQGRIAWHEGAVADAVHYYAQQAAHDSSSGAASLLFVARSLLAHRDQLDKALDDPVAQRLLAAYLYTRSDEFAVQWPLAGSGGNGPTTDDDGNLRKSPDGIDVEAFVKIVTAHGLAHFDGADRLAAGLYRAGHYDLAGQLAARSDTALAAWVRAKLALRAGDKATAAREYAAAAKGFPASEDWGGASEIGEASLQSPLCRVEDERGMLALSRDDYVEAMTRMYAGASQYWPDAAYVAERVLSVDELKSFVDANVKAPPPPRHSGDDAGAYGLPPPATALRALLARRLMRAGRMADALAYFDDTQLRKQAQALIDAHRDDHAWSSSKRAAALFAQAKLVRAYGMELLGAELEPDGAMTDGNFDAGGLPSMKDREWTGGGEAARVTASAIVPDARYHYRYLAANLAEQAASLVPARSQAYAAMMCSATGWMLDTDSASAQRIYHRYLRNGAHVAWARNFGHDCPAPDFAAARWLPWKLRYHATRHWARLHWPLPLGGLLVLAAGLAMWKRRRKTA
ncbi:MAG: hypothetical protein JSR26_12965 [Proteobacteria bacterium]|nr:hypothetical protein [Pseudomonadota bacterium]